MLLKHAWLGEEITDSEISPPDYQLYRLDHNRHGGGVLMYVHNNYSCKVITGPAQLDTFLFTETVIELTKVLSTTLLILHFLQLIIFFQFWRA